MIFLKVLTMVNTRNVLIGIVLGVFSLIMSQGVVAEDWPTWRYDSNRSAASPEELSDELKLQWVRELPAPKTAWPDEPKLDFDRTYEPVVMGQTMYVSSMAGDSVTALDTVTGDVLWQFYADAPVRFAPVVWEGKVYFTADDGFLYCVTADERLCCFSRVLT